MQITTLYKCKRFSGGITITTRKPRKQEYTELYRLIADEGMVLTNGEVITSVVDTETPDVWTEIDSAEEIDDSVFIDMLRGVL